MIEKPKQVFVTVRNLRGVRHLGIYTEKLSEEILGGVKPEEYIHRDVVLKAMAWFGNSMVNRNQQTPEQILDLELKE